MTLAVLTIAGGSCSASLPPPSPAQCVAEWNANPPVDDFTNQDASISVSGGTNKAGEVGCAVVVVSAVGEAWTMYSRETGDPAGTGGTAGGWGGVFGAAWGEDSPEGGPTEFNAAPVDAGRIALI